MTEEDLSALELRVAKGWVVRPDQIKALIGAVRTYRDRPMLVVQADAKAGDGRNGSAYPGGVLWMPKGQP